MFPEHYPMTTTTTTAKANTTNTNEGQGRAGGNTVILYLKDYGFKAEWYFHSYNTYNTFAM